MKKTEQPPHRPRTTAAAAMMIKLNEWNKNIHFLLPLAQIFITLNFLQQVIIIIFLKYLLYIFLLHPLTRILIIFFMGQLMIFHRNYNRT